MNSNQIIEEFLEGTDAWIASMKKQGKLLGSMICPYCGIEPDKMKHLMEAVREAQEKAWMYDDLSK